MQTIIPIIIALSEIQLCLNKGDLFKSYIRKRLGGQVICQKISQNTIKYYLAYVGDQWIIKFCIPSIFCKQHNHSNDKPYNTNTVDHKRNGVVDHIVTESVYIQLQQNHKVATKVWNCKELKSINFTRNLTTYLSSTQFVDAS